MEIIGAQKFNMHVNLAIEVLANLAKTAPVSPDKWDEVLRRVIEEEHLVGA